MLSYCSCINETKNQKTDETINQQNKPDYEIALNFINDYVNYQNSKKKNNSDSLWVNQNPLLTSSFKQQYNLIIQSALPDDPGLGFDPIVNAQDYPDKGFEIMLEEPNSGFLSVKGIEWSDFLLTMKIVENQGKWLVDGCGIINIPTEKQAKR